MWHVEVRGQVCGVDLSFIFLWTPEMELELPGCSDKPQDPLKYHAALRGGFLFFSFFPPVILCISMDSELKRRTYALPVSLRL